jgi:hypothetical protein
MRSFFLILFLIGAGIAFVYPWAVRSVEGQDIGTWRLYEASAGFTPAEVPLRAGQSPVRIRIDLTGIVPAGPDAEARPVLTLTVSGDDRTLVAEALNVGGAEVLDDSPQTPQRLYRVDLGPMEVPVDGAYVFTAGPGEVEGVDIIGVDLVLNAGLGAYDERALPLGLSIMAIGFIGFVIAMRRASARKAAAAAKPDGPRWGRGAGS